MTKITRLTALGQQQAEVFRQARGSELFAEDAITGTKGILDHTYPNNLRRHQFIPDWWLEPEQQIEKVQAFLDRNGMFRTIPPAPYFRQLTLFEVLMLAVYMPAYMGVDGVQRTRDAWSSFIVPPKGCVKHVWDEFSSDSNHLRLLGGIKHRPDIRWIVIDLNANMDMSPKSCWNNPQIASRLASVEVLMAAAIFDKWQPNCNLAGYQFYDGKEWDMAPCLTNVDVSGQLIETAYPANMVQIGRSNPEIVRVLTAA